MTHLDPAQLAREGDHPVQIDRPMIEPLVIVLAGPIKAWWAEERWGDDAHHNYLQWRDAVRIACVKHGFLVYSPHRAWQGAWSESAQRVNDMAVAAADLVLDLTPPGTPAEGTAGVAEHARRVGTPILAVPPADGAAIDDLIKKLHVMHSGYLP